MQSASYSYKLPDIMDIKHFSVLTHEVLTSDPLVPPCVFNRACQRLTRLHQTTPEADKHLEINWFIKEFFYIQRVAIGHL